jgi:hypothetical protein
MTVPHQLQAIPPAFSAVSPGLFASVPLPLTCFSGTFGGGFYGTFLRQVFSR